MVKESKTLHPLLSNIKAYESVYARQFVYSTKDGQKKLTYSYIAATELEIWEQYISQGTRTICEVIDARKPCHLYIDIDVDLKRTPGIKVYDCWKSVQPIIKGHFDILYPGTEVEYICMDSSNNKKGSLHIVVKIKGYIFTNASHCGAYMRVLKKFIETKHPEVEGAFSFIDMGIYTRNRLFRMLGQTKAGQKRYLKSHCDFTFENWQNTRVCPISSTDELITTREPDGGNPIYTSGSNYGAGECTVVAGWIPECVTGDIYRYLSNEVGRIQRMVFTGENMKIICNTNNRRCMFQNRQHRSNVMYIVINLINRSYHIKCHSQHCKKKRSKVYFFDQRLRKIIDEWMNRKVGSQPV
tara:strand:+ start:6403 stop:7467 length:1065 start_codon:yes stop_codon:yes gene_type:complete